jgi:hypothetical protein
VAFLARQRRAASGKWKRRLAADPRVFDAFADAGDDRLLRLPRVDARHDRVSRNEAMYRAVNREIEQVSEAAGGGGADQLEVLCECGEDGCSTTLTLTIAEYDETHGQRDRFIVASGHEDPH